MPRNPCTGIVALGWIAVAAVGACAGSPVVVLAEDDLPHSIAVAGAFVFWDTMREGTVKRVSTEGGAVQVLYDGGVHDVSAYADRIYYVRNNGVVSLDLDGGDETIVWTETDFHSPLCIVSAAIGVYWGLAGEIWGARGIAEETRMLAYPVPDPCVEDLDDTALYISSDVDIVRLELSDGATPQSLIGPIDINGNQRDSEYYNPKGGTVDDTFLYWTEGGGCLRVPKRGGTPEVLADDQDENMEGTLSNALDVEVDDTHVYWVNTQKEEGSLNRIAKGGGEIETLAANQDWPFELALDGDWIYWTAAGSFETGKVLKMRKPER